MALLSAVPTTNPKARRQRVVLAGEVANPAAPPSGCYFHPRCPFAVERCRVETPALVEVEPGRLARCHRAGELTLAGV
jgi:peptide/nickel transport system ATP-binding protein